MVEIVPYNPNYPTMFQKAAIVIAEALGENCINIYHVGSTAVKHLDGKPKIDIIAEVKNLNFDDKALLDLGCIYRGGFNIPLRKSYDIRNSNIDINLHIFEQNDPEIELNLKFISYLKENNEAKEEYQKLKYDLIKDPASHIKQNSIYVGYTLGKHELIQAILRKVGFDKTRFLLATHNNEWEKVRYFRQKYFFGKVPMDDPYEYTFNHENHRHLILVKDKIIAYAHVQLWPENRAILRIIVVDAENQKSGYGIYFLNLIEKYLKLINVKSLHIDSSPEAFGFYKKQDYIEMLLNDPDGYESHVKDIAIGKIL